MKNFSIIRPIESADRVYIKSIIDKDWGGEPLVVRGEKYYPSKLEGLVVEEQNKIIGFLFYDIQGDICEIVVFEILRRHKGIGTAVLQKLKAIARDKNCHKLHLMTTNDNLDALRFYQKRGFYICGVHVDSVKRSRAIKPSIGEIGEYGIPLRDEIDLELLL